MLDLILGAGLVVKLVLLALLFMSVASWAVILFKARELRAAELDTEGFLEAYLERPLDTVFEAAKDYPSSPLSAIFQSGYRDLSQLTRLSGSADAIPAAQVEGVAQRLAWVQTEEGHRLQRGLSFLATVGSSAPFIGLFGTVVGIMNSFNDIGQTGSANLAVVAPGIAEALVATAVGLFAAIPAVIGYNYMSARLERLLERLEAFRSEFADSLRRSSSQAA
jgi:biopolymer transport protein TolQ